jgi:signal peptidase I
MNDSQPSPTLVATPALLDVWHLAVYLARHSIKPGVTSFLGGLWNRPKPIEKSEQALPTDCQILQAYLSYCRAFTPADSLVKHLGGSARQLRSQLKRLEKAHGQQVSQLMIPAFNNGPQSEADELPSLINSPLGLLQRAKAIAIEAHTSPSKKIALDITHLVQAMCYSDDPILAQLIKTNGWTANKVMTAAGQVRQKRWWLHGCYLLKELVEVLLVVLTFLIVIKEGLGELRLIPSESMLPLLQVEDRIVVEKLTRWWRPYQRGDVLVFYPPMTQLKTDLLSLFLRSTGFSNAFHKKDDNIDVAYIKRLIGLPGDTVDVRPGDGVYINGVKLTEPYVNEVALSCTKVLPVETCGPVTIPEGHYFMMGDNRNQSADSRYWGFEPIQRVVGRAVFRVWPYGRFGALPAANKPIMRETPTSLYSHSNN